MSNYSLLSRAAFEVPSAPPIEEPEALPVSKLSILEHAQTRKLTDFHEEFRSYDSVNNAFRLVPAVFTHWSFKSFAILYNVPYLTLAKDTGIDVDWLMENDRRLITFDKVFTFSDLLDLGLKFAHFSPLDFRLENAITHSLTRDDVERLDASLNDNQRRVLKQSFGWKLDAINAVLP